MARTRCQLCQLTILVLETAVVMGKMRIISSTNGQVLPVSPSVTSLAAWWTMAYWHCWMQRSGHMPVNDYLVHLWLVLWHLQSFVWTPAHMLLFIKHYQRSVVVSGVGLINEVNQHWARLVLGWVAACLRVNHLTASRYVTSHLGQLSLLSLRGR